MKRTLSKSLAWLLTLLMLLTAMPVNALSEALVQPTPAADATPLPIEEEGNANAAPAESTQPEETSAPADTLSLSEADVQLPVQNDAALYAVKPDTDKYLTYKFYNGDVLLSEQTVKAGDTLYAPDVTTGAHEKFVGWDPAVSFGTVGAIAESRTIEVRAKIETVYYVFFKDEGGCIIKTVEAGNGETVPANATFQVAADKSLTGWYTDAALANKVSSVTISGNDVTLYPKVETGYWVSYVSNGGSYISPKFYTTSETAAAPAVPTKAGYDFAEWYTDEALNTVADFSAIKTNTTVYAKWTASARTQYTVIHWQENANDDDYSYAASETMRGTTGTQTRAAARSYQGFTAQTVTQQTIAGDGSTIVNVYYKRNVYSVKFYSNSRRGNPSTEYVSLRITAKYGAYIGDQWPTYDGSNTWATRDNGDTYQANIDTMPLGGTNFYGPKTGWGSETAYYYVEVLPGETAEVTYNRVGYKLDHKDTSPGTGYSVTNEDKYPITGFTYKEGTRNGGDYNNARFYYTRNSYNIVFVNNGSTDKTVSRKYEQSIADASYTPTAPVGMEGYVFSGWYENELCEGTAFVFDGKTMPAQNITLYAKWVAPVHTVTVYDADKINVVGTIKDIAHADKISEGDMPEYAAPEGQEFLGWVLADGTAFSFDTEIRRDYAIYASTRSTGRFTVTYDPNGGEGTAFTDAESYAEGAKADVKANAFTNGNKVFLGWNTAADGTGATYYPGSSLEIGTEDVTLYAIWGDKAQAVMLTYHANGGSGDDVAESHANNELVTLKGEGTFTRTGYTLTGWNTKADGTGTSFGLGASARVDNIDSNELYAVWTINEYAYTVEYYIDGVKDDTLTESGKANYSAEIDTYTDKCPDGYVLDKTENLPLTIGTDESANVIKVYYKKNVFDLTIHYVYAEGGKAADDHTESVQFGKDYNVTSPDVTGYTVDKATVSGTMPAENVEVTVTYTRRSDLSYTVNYYWNGTTEKVADSKTFDGQTFGAVATESPIAVTGYTAVSNAAKEVTIAVEGNVIDFYYYKNVELTPNSDTVTYNGAEQNVSGFTGAPEGADFSAITVGTAGTDAGEYAANFAEGTVGTVDATAKYIVAAANSGKLVINKRDVAFSGASDSKVYTGSEQELTDITVAGLVSGHTYESLSYSAKGTNVGEYDGAFSSDVVIKDAQGNDVTKNYNVTKTPGKLTITKAEKLVVKVTGNTSTVDYNGATKFVEGFSSNAPADVTVSLKEGKTAKAEGVNVGTYPMNLKAEDFTATSDNYEAIVIEVADGWLKIEPVDIEGNVTLTPQNVVKKYDGKTYTAGAATATDKNGGKLTIEYSVDGENWTTDNTAITAKNVADSKTVNVRVSGSNYTGYVTGTEKLTITMRSVTLTSGSDSKVYDGTPLTKDVVTVDGDGFAEGEGATYTVTGTITNVGEVGNAFTYTLSAGTEEGNYDITSEYGLLTITPVTDKVVVKITEHSGSAKYDGTEKFVEGYDVAISNPLYTEADFRFAGKESGKTAYVAGIDAGVYEMQLESRDFVNVNNNFSNVEFVIVDGALTISPRSVTLKSETDSKVYDGTALTRPDVTVSGDGFVADEAKDIKAIGTITNVGSVKNEITFAVGDAFKEGNYDITLDEGTLTITPVTDKVTVTITEHSGSAKYDGAEKIVTGYDVAIDNELYKENDFEFSGDATIKGTDAGSYDMALKSGDFKNVSNNFTNVEFVIVDGKLEIAKRSVTLTSASDKKVYDGTPLTNDTVTVGGDGFAENEGATYDVTGKQTDVGKSANTFGYTLNEGTKAGNYIIEKDTGMLEVTPVTDEVIVKIEGNKATYEYDATEKIVTGYKVVSISNSLYKEADLSLAENAKSEARGIDAGEYLMGLTALSFVNNSGNFVNVKFVVEDGKLTIARRGSGDMKVTVTANDNKGIIYDGKAHGENGYTSANLAEGHSVKSVVIDGSQIDAGLYEDELVPHDAIIVDAQGNDVTRNYELTYIAGDLEITKRGIPDDPKDPDDPKLVKIIANDNKAEYDGQAHGENGYTSSNLAEGQSVKSAQVVGSKTEVGLHEDALVPQDAIIVDAQGNDVTKNYVLTYVAGDLEITKRTATVTANDNKGILYDGKEHGGNGYTSANLLDGHTVTGVVIDGAKVDAGLYEDALVPHDAVIVDAQGNDVSGNYEVTYVAGDLEITPIMDEIVVKITGHKGYFIYDGTRKTLIGYDVEVSDPSYSEDNIVFTGRARVHGIEPGIYMMGLEESQFHDKGNYANVKFIVVDGVMTIVRGKHYVAWLHDTSTMIDSAEKNETLNAISDYIERTKIQTVFHSGNVVADAASQEQWDAFNDTMKHLYDNERRTFIVNGAAQDTVENSLFLDQPFREDYLESDMFEEGKGVVDRFEMGGIEMIMVTLGDDALTEEGLKWARDVFNANSERVGILMVNSYLTEDKKIAEGAEEIEKQIVSVCGNVRLVLSSNGEYASHESFKYGDRTVWALNANIDAATAEGYITLLEFDADTRSLYVTTYSPVKNDFVYDDEKLEYEQFTLYNAF